MNDDRRLNCWEALACSRTTASAGQQVCPAYASHQLTGVNDGARAGRICWAVAGTFCGGEVQGTFAEKQATCMSCDFFKQVREEQKGNFSILAPGQSYRLRPAVVGEKLG